ncbi:MAG: hypothetical protein EOO61_14140 [Hymenobacter sp.]|nr:MAG: hypothetical protein EOO61_14140 [Hymenobacter sp.]
MSTTNLELTKLGIDRSKLVAQTEEILREAGLDYDHTVGFDIRYESSGNGSIWAVAFKTAPNPFGFDCETYFVELNMHGELLDILTPRGRFSQIKGLSKPIRNRLLVHS